MNKGINKILGFMKLSDNEYEDDYEYDIDLEEEEEEAVPKKKKSVVNKSTSRRRKVASGSEDILDDYDDIDFQEEEPVARKSRNTYASSRKSSKKRSNIYSMPNAESMSRTMEVHVTKPSEFDNCQEISNIILSGCAAIINFESVEAGDAQRIIDFVSGVCYAIGGDAKPVSESIIVVTPKDIDITGDLQMLAASTGVDVPNFNYEADEK